MATDIDSKIKAIKEEIRKTPYHKGTEHYIGYLKAKLAKLRREAAETKPKSKGKGFALKKSGDATVVLIGPPSVGKSSLLNKLTHARARVEEWPFTTLEVIPGMLEYQGAKIQILDLPGIIKGATKGVGRGREVLSVAGSADLLILMVDLKTKQRIGSILKELKKIGISLPTLVVVNKADLAKKTPPKIKSDWILISALKGTGLEKLKKAIWQELKLIRIYLKPKGKKADLNKPLIMKEGQKVIEVVEKIFPSEGEVNQAFLWGPDARFPGQPVSLNRELKDGDILTFV